mgnify:CR=1 FL=1
MSYHTYITTNSKRTTLYIGFTNNLELRIIEHYRNRGNPKTFAGRYHCYNLVWFEAHHRADGGIQREKEIKKWRREKKIALIEAYNPEWHFLNSDITVWPPEDGTRRF